MDRITQLIAELNAAQVAQFAEYGYTHKPDVWHYKPGTAKFSKIDCGGSGAFMVENATGELYNIQGYGRPDYNKKKKADIGNVATQNGAELFKLRYNYLR